MRAAGGGREWTVETRLELSLSLPDEAQAGCRVSSEDFPRLSAQLSVCPSVCLLACPSVCLLVSPCVSQRMYFELLRCKFKKDDASGTAAAATRLDSARLSSTRLDSKNGKTKGYCDKDLLVCPPTTTSTGLSDARPLSCAPRKPVVIYEFQG